MPVAGSVQHVLQYGITPPQSHCSPRKHAPATAVGLGHAVGPRSIPRVGPSAAAPAGDTAALPGPCDLGCGTGPISRRPERHGSPALHAICLDGPPLGGPRVRAFPAQPTLAQNSPGSLRLPRAGSAKRRARSGRLRGGHRVRANAAGGDAALRPSARRGRSSACRRPARPHTRRVRRSRRALLRLACADSNELSSTPAHARPASRACSTAPAVPMQSRGCRAAGGMRARARQPARQAAGVRQALPRRGRGPRAWQPSPRRRPVGRSRGRHGAGRLRGCAGGRRPLQPSAACHDSSTAQRQHCFIGRLPRRLHAQCIIAAPLRREKSHTRQALTPVDKVMPARSRPCRCDSTAARALQRPRPPRPSRHAVVAGRAAAAASARTTWCTAAARAARVCRCRASQHGCMRLGCLPALRGETRPNGPASVVGPGGARARCLPRRMPGPARQPRQRTGRPGRVPACPSVAPPCAAIGDAQRRMLAGVLGSGGHVQPRERAARPGRRAALEGPSRRVCAVAPAGGAPQPCGGGTRARQARGRRTQGCH